MRPSRRRAPSRYSSADRSEPLRRFGKVVSQAPVEVERLIRLLSRGVAVERMAVSVAWLCSRCRIFASERPVAAVFRCSCVQRGETFMREAVRRLVVSVEAE